MQLEAFQGRWDLDRDIEDVRAGRSGRFAGRAEFQPTAAGLAYHEEGLLALDGAAPLTATREYLWRDGGAGAIEVFFGDGRFFHRFLADEPEPAAAHDCPPDRYRVRYDFRQWPRWTAAWRVSGPRKDYRLVSRFAPAKS
jgi:hypothetical protein